MEFAVQTTREPTVSLRSSLDVKEQVKQAIDIVDLVGSYLQLRRQGRQYVALCPWHDDTRPSLQVNPERQSFKCWVCDIGGDVFSFLMQMEGVTFPEALAMLADKAGVALRPQRKPDSGSGETPSDEGGGAAADKRTLYRAMAWAEQQYHACLVDLPEGEPGRRYLAERGITQASIEQFHLGFCPESADWLLQRAEAARANTRLLETIGILMRSAGGGRPYDRFRGRVLFSIRNARGMPVGLGGRVLPENAAGTPAKYLNSPETPLFRKSEELYGLDVARDAVRKSRTAVVMEGYTDCIVAHQYGFQNTVAVLGTALGEGHLKILKRFADRIVLVLDGDEAGQRRANEVLELFVAQQVDLRIVTLAEEKDPCDFLLKRGAEAFAELLEKGAVDALEHAYQSHTRGLDLERDIHGASQALDRLIAIVAKAPRHRDDTTRDDRLREEKILQRLAARFRIDEADIRRRITELRRRTGQLAAKRVEVPRESSPETPAERIPALERELLELLIQHPQHVPQARATISPQQLSTAASRRIFEACCNLTDEGIPATFSKLMIEFDEPALKSLLVDLDEQGRAKTSAIAEPAALLEEVLREFQHRESQKQFPAHKVALREGQLGPDQALDLVRQLVEQKRARQGISRPTEE